MHRYQLPKTRRINHHQQPLVVVHSSSTPFVNNDWSVVCKPEQPKMKTYNDVLFVALTLGITMTGKDYTRITGERSVIQILSLVLILILICKKSRGKKKNSMKFEAGSRTKRLTENNLFISQTCWSWKSSTAWIGSEGYRQFIYRKQTHTLSSFNILGIRGFMSDPLWHTGLFVHTPWRMNSNMYLAFINFQRVLLYEVGGIWGTTSFWSFIWSSVGYFRILNNRINYRTSVQTLILYQETEPHLKILSYWKIL